MPHVAWTRREASRDRHSRRPAGLRLALFERLRACRLELLRHARGVIRVEMQSHVGCPLALVLGVPVLLQEERHAVQLESFVPCLPIDVLSRKQALRASGLAEELTELISVVRHDCDHDTPTTGGVLWRRVHVWGGLDVGASLQKIPAGTNRHVGGWSVWRVAMRNEIGFASTKEILTPDTYH